MARDISIAISAKDNFTQAITTMRNANQAFNKDLTGLTAKLDELNKTKIMLKVDTDKARMALRDAQRQFMATGDAADKLALELANANYENARRNLDLVSKSARQTEKDILNLTRTTSKLENRAGSRNEKSMLSTLASAGLTQLVGSALSNTANTLVSSAYGSEAGTMFSSILASAAAGAAIGSLIPGIGTAIGATVGGITGAIAGATSIYESRDDAFKQYYQDQYNAIKEAQTTALTSGSEIAAVREQHRISFATLLGGDDRAVDFLKQLTQFAARTPFEYDDLTTISKTLLAYGYSQEELIPLLTKVGDAGSALGMGIEDMRYVAIALGRMQSTGKTTLEYLNPLLERGIPVWEYLAEASGKTKEEVQEMVSKGLVPGEEAAKAIADYMGYDFAGNMERQSKTFQGLTSTLQDIQNELNNAIGQAYIDERKKGLQEEIDFLSGESGEKMQEAYRQIGMWQASLENLKEQYERDALTAVMTGTISSLFSDEVKERLTEMYKQYTELASDDTEEAGAKMGQLLAEAQAIAQNEYNASEGAQIALQSNKELADKIKNDAGLKDEYWDAGYEMGVQFSKGLASAMNGINTSDLAPNRQGFTLEQVLEGQKNFTIRTHAYGLSYVPYDNYPALLHEGERVLTASENRNYGKGASTVITGNNFYVREEADIQKIAREIVKQMIRAFQLAD